MAKPKNDCWLCDGQLYVKKSVGKTSKRCPECVRVKS